MPFLPPKFVPVTDERKRERRILLFGRFIFALKAETLEALVEIEIVARTGDFSQLPTRPVFVIESCGPGFRQGFGIRHRDVDLQMVSIDSPKALGYMKLIAMRVPQAVQPRFFVESH